MLKREKLAIKTISLPAPIAQRVDRIARKENTTVSDLFRESFRLYEREYALRAPKKSKHAVEWVKLKRTLAFIAKQGKRKCLSQFIARDRRSN